MDEDNVGGVVVDEDGQVATPAAETEDERLVAAEPEETPEEAAELANAADDKEREEIRTRRRQERKDRKQHQRDKMDTLERQVQALSQQNAQLQAQIAGVHNITMGQQMARVDDELAKAERAERQFKDLIAEATEKGDGRIVADATQNMLGAQQRKQELALLRQRMGTAAQQTAQPHLNPLVKENARVFMEKHKWYKADGSDVDSRVLNMVDNSLVAEGWDPALPEYWQELESRAKKYMPTRFPEKGDNAPQRRKAPAASVSGGAGAANAGGANGSTYLLSAERVKALKESGKWDNLEERKKMIKAYRDYDKQNAR